jgi:serine protease Do
MITQIKDHGSVTRGWLGVQIQTLTPEIAASVGAANTKGAIVASVVGNSPASQAGIHQGDVIVGLNGSDIADSRDLTRRVANLSAGSKAEFTILRDGKKETLTATIAKRDQQVSSNETGPRSSAKPSGETTLGMNLAPVTPDARQEFGLDDNVRVWS